MFEVAVTEQAEATRLYRLAEIVFPIVGTVLCGSQDGIVYVDDRKEPGQVYVEHAFGFAQLFGYPNSAFEAALARHLNSGAFRAPKVRLYAPRIPEVLSVSAYKSIRSERQRFRLLDRPQVRGGDDATIRSARAHDLDELEATFGVVRRFWRVERDFLNWGRPSLAVRDGRIAAICYAAAHWKGHVEIDVATRPEARREGLGLAVASHFIASCQADAIEPLWDCFTNNAPSIALSAALGFRPVGKPYSFFTFAR